MRKKLRDKIESLLQGKIPLELVEKFPSRYQKLGDIILLRLPEELLPYKHEIGMAVLKVFPNVKTVLRYVKGISGELRLPSVEIIAGEQKTETIHEENNCLYKLDVAKVMFSRDNKKERARIPKLVKEGETVVDMFAGIGYFTIPIAKLANPKIIYAIELNPISVRYLRENLILNRIEDKVKIIEGDCRVIAPKLGPIADRVIMGYFPQTYEFLPFALKVLKPTGGIIHYHDIFKKEELFEKPISILKKISKENGYHLKKVLYTGIVKSYAPKTYHIVVDAFFETVK